MNEIDREAFEERAAIMEFDGGLPRGEAERMAARALLATGKMTDPLDTAGQLPLVL